MYTQAQNFTRKSEGESLMMYLCPAKHHTIAVGHNLDAKPITQDVCDLIFKHDYDDAVGDAQKWLGSAWDTLDDVRRGVVTDMSFNMGLEALEEFVNTRAAIIAGDWEKAAIEMADSAWAREVSTRAEALMKVMRAGDWSVLE